jgi:hypothetical protein
VGEAERFHENHSEEEVGEEEYQDLLHVLQEPIRSVLAVYDL